MLERPDLNCLRLQHALTRDVINRVVSHPGHLDLFIYNHATHDGPMTPSDIQMLETPNGFAAAPFAAPLPPPQPLNAPFDIAAC